MAGTPTSALIGVARAHLNELTPDFWSDDELLAIARRGYTDLWAAIIDLDQEYFATVDTTNVSLQANATQLTGVPADCFKVHLIEPLDLTTGDISSAITFIPRDYNHRDFIAARSLGNNQTNGGSVVCFTLIGAGAPLGAPTILTAPPLSSAVNLRFMYIPTLGVQNYTLQTMNPIPGESDNAIVAWIVAYAMAKQGETQDGSAPNASWLSIYATEKNSLLVRMKPREDVEPNYVDGIFGNLWGV